MPMFITKVKTTITNFLDKSIGPNSSDLRRASNKVEAIITQWIQKRGIPDTFENRKSLYEKACQSTILLPKEGLVLYLHELNNAAKIPDEQQDKHKLIKTAIRGLQHWKDVMESQKNDGHRMAALAVSFYNSMPDFLKIEKLQNWMKILEPQKRDGDQMVDTKAFYTQCEQRMNEIDPTRKIRDEISVENGLVTLVKKSALLASVYLLARYLGPNYLSAFTLTMTTKGFYELTRTLRSHTYQSMILMCVNGFFLYKQVSSLLVYNGIGAASNNVTSGTALQV